MVGNNHQVQPSINNKYEQEIIYIYLSKTVQDGISPSNSSHLSLNWQNCCELNTNSIHENWINRKDVNAMPLHDLQENVWTEGFNQNSTLEKGLIKLLNIL